MTSICELAILAQMSPFVIVVNEDKSEQVEVSEETLAGIWHALRERYEQMSIPLNRKQSKELVEITKAIAKVSKEIGR